MQSRILAQNLIAGRLCLKSETFGVTQHTKRSLLLGFIVGEIKSISFDSTEAWAVDCECLDFLLRAALTKLDESELKLRVTKSLTESPLKSESWATACSLPQNSTKSIRVSC